MNIFVKYCGGCNPRYDRAQIIKRLKEDFNDIHIMTHLNDRTCDFVLVLSGCMTSCVNHEELHGKYGKMVIKDLGKYYKLKSRLEEIKEEEQNELE